MAASDEGGRSNDSPPGAASPPSLTLPPESFEAPPRPPPGPDASERGAPAGAAGRRDASERGVLPVGDWDRYEFVAPLGRGGMGEVHEACDRRLGRAVALKFIRGADPERVMRLLQEARAQARIDHPNVCKVYEVGEVAGKAYIAMQLVRGQRLDEAALEMTLPAKARVVQQIAGAVHEAHRLGVVHRDLKPANVLVGLAEDGRLQPVVLDFGLAYEVNQGHGLTAAGALLGTPAYMAPEQARGDLGGVDQRSDVYALGATLYELLAGEAPFRDTTLAGLLHKVLHDEPAPLRERWPQVPADLETIALKCLHKDPGRRYPSARALAEDLGRYLDGEPILGRRPGLAERLVRRARRHRALTALAGLSLAVTLVLGAFGGRAWLEARRTRAEAAGRARLAEELGQEVKEIEWFLRAAYALPLHDSGPEQARARERMADIAARRPEPGGLGEGLVHYALGRGHLALGEFEAAERELARAGALGLDTPDLHHARGRALGELYHRTLEEARVSGGVAWVAERQRALEAQYLEPALIALEKGRGLKLESPRYLEGLIAFYRRDYDAAARAAERAAAEAPWAHEARRLAGDVAYARAMEQLGRGDYDGAREGLEGAAALYERAAEIGRSDALTYEALAEAWLRRAEADQRQGRPRAEALGRALDAAGRAVRAAPGRAAGHTRRAYVLMNWYWLQKFEGGGRDPEGALDEWVAAAERALELDPGDVYAHDTLGYAHFLRGLERARRGDDPEPAFGEAVTRLGEALRRKPNYPWGLNDLASVHHAWGNYRREHGRDPRPDLAEAERHLRRATQSDPAYLFAYAALANVHDTMAAYDVERGLDPGPNVERALEAGRRALELDGHYYQALNAVAAAELSLAQHLAERGDDPRPAVDRAIAQLERSRAINPAAGRTPLYLALCHLALARRALRAGEAPGLALEAGRRALAEATRDDADCVECRVTAARLSLVEAEWARARGAAEGPALDRALGEARQAVEALPYADAHRELARVYWRRAEVSPARAAAGAIDAGLRQADAALRLEPNSAPARAARAGLLVARARAERVEGARREAAAEALAELGRAFDANPLARREYEGVEREAKRLLGEAPR